MRAKPAYVSVYYYKYVVTVKVDKLL